MAILQIIGVLLQFGETKLVKRIADLLARTADTAEQFVIVTQMYLALGENVLAIEFGEKAIEKGSDDIKLNLPQRLYPTYKAEFNFTKAVSIIESMVQMNPDNLALKIEKALCYYETNRKEEAHDILKTIDEKNLDDFAKLKFRAALGPHQLRNGQFQTGLRNVILSQDAVRKAEFNHQYHGGSELPLPMWMGTPDCKKLIIYLEAGLGDEIINVRFLRNLKSLGITAKLYNVWYEEPRKNNRQGMIEFYEKNGFEFIHKFNPDEYQDYQWTYSQFLPILLNVSEKELWTGPYLKAKTKKLKGKNKIGLRWSGNPVPKYRNFPLKEVYNSLKDLDVTFYSIQKHVCMDELAEFPEIVDLSGKMPSLADMADYINSFDLLISCATVSCTLAGALDKECIVLNPCNDYYIFNTKTEHTPWFSDKMTLLRQNQPKNWSDVMPDLRKLVEKKLNL